MIRLRTRWLTSAAQAWLARTREGRVMGVFERACNLVNQDGAVLTLVTRKSGLTPFSLVVETDQVRPFQAVSATSRVEVTADGLGIGDVSVDVAGAALWDPRPNWSAVRRALVDHPERLAALAELALEVGKPGSLLELALTPRPPLPTLASGEGAPKAGVRLKAGATLLIPGLLSGSLDACLAGARGLAGLGGGLTPAGDDFIVGVMLAAWAGVYGEGAEALCGPMAETAAPLTTTLSAAYLRAAARGECTALWHALFQAVDRAEETAVRSAIRDLLAVGHTSGADALAGFLAVHWLPDGIPVPQAAPARGDRER